MEQATFIPDMNGANVGHASKDGAPQQFQSDGTMIEGMPYGNPYSPDTASNKNMGQSEPNPSYKNQGTPVVGFLYSVSKNGFPEYWPLYVGRNRVGKGHDVDICLREASVSDHHADIQIKKMRQQGGKLIATIVDAGSKNGIILNDEELDYDRHSLKNGDVLTIGLHYKMVFLLVDPIEFGLQPVEGFVALDNVRQETPSAPAVPPIPSDATFSPGAPNHSTSDPYSNPYENYRNQDETVNISGQNYSGLNAGGTRIL